jgi:hypothetical protein
MSSGGTTTLTVASARTQLLLGSTTQTYKLPDATTLSLGQSFLFVNSSSGLLTVTDNASATVAVIPSGGVTQLGALNVSTVAGTWGAYSFLPESYSFTNSTASFGNATITNAVWNGTQIGTNYGGTGLVSFSAANNALYSTSSSALTAGTLPVAAGGTGITSTTPYAVVAGGTTSTGTLQQVSGLGTSGQVLTSNGTGTLPTWQTPSGGATKAQAIAYAMTLGF